MVKEFSTIKRNEVPIKIDGESYTVRTRLKLAEAFHFSGMLEMSKDPIGTFEKNTLEENKRLADKLIDTVDSICSAPREVIEELDLIQLFEIIGLVEVGKAQPTKRKSARKSSAKPSRG